MVPRVEHCSTTRLFLSDYRNIYSTELCTEDWIDLLLSPSLSTLPPVCASVEISLFLKHALLFEAAEVFVAHFMMTSKGQI